MPEGSTLPEPDAEPIPFFLPENKHDAGLRIAQIARISRKRPKIEAKYNIRIAKAKARLEELQRERATALKDLDERSSPPAHELTEYLRRCWSFLTKNGTTKLVRFWSGELSLRNHRERARVDNPKEFMAEARRRGKARLLITRGADKPNLTALNKDLALAATFKSVTIERNSSITIRPKSGWGILQAVLPRRMEDKMEIDELIGDDTLSWRLRASGDDEE